jgi:hypothetical protein
MSENLKLMRFFFVVLGIFTVGRWGLSLAGADYEKTHQIFSIVILTNISTLFYGFITRSFVGGGIKRALVLAASMAVVAQIVIFGSTVVSYLLGMETFFNNARALNAPEAIPLGQAVVGRSVGLVVNVVTNLITGALGYAIAGVVPRSR